jgi:hypothetical protein
MFVESGGSSTISTTFRGTLEKVNTENIPIGILATSNLAVAASINSSLMSGRNNVINKPKE